MDAETGEGTSLEERYQQISDQWPDRKVELIDDRIVVREVRTRCSSSRWSPRAVATTITRSSRGDARGGVPLYLVIDTFAGRVRLLSRPGEKGYGRQVEVRLGEPLELPDPWSLTLDTSVLTG
jgi:hypothetical protein